MELPILAPDAAPTESRPLLDGIAADLGLVPNLAATVAASPTLLTAFDGLRRAVADPSFDPVNREIAGLATGVAVGNAYGVAFHSTVLARLGVDAAEVDAMRRGDEPTDAVRGAVYAFARALVLDRGVVDDAVVARATAAGLSAADLLQITAECSFATLVGLVDNLAGGVALDAFLQPQAWSAQTRATAAQP